MKICSKTAWQMSMYLQWPIYVETQGMVIKKRADLQAWGPDLFSSGEE